MQIKRSGNEKKIKQPAALSSHQHQRSAPRKREVIGPRFSAGLSASRTGCALRSRRSGHRPPGGAGQGGPGARRGRQQAGSPLAVPRPHLEEVVLVHHAAVGQRPPEPPGQGGFPAVRDPAARARARREAARGHVRARHCGSGTRKGGGRGREGVPGPGPAPPRAPPPPSCRPPARHAALTRRCR